MKRLPVFPQRTALGVVIGLVLCVAAVGCGETEDRVAAKRPAMEVVVKEYETVLVDVRAAVDEAFGKQDWEINDAGPGSASCEGVKDAAADSDTVYLPLSTTMGMGYAERDAIVSAINPVAKRHGFGALSVRAGGKGLVSYQAADKYFGFLFVTVSDDGFMKFDIQTGCHVWNTRPTENSLSTELPPDPD